MTRIVGVAAALSIATAYFLPSALPTFGDSTGTVNATVSVAAARPLACGRPWRGLDFGTLAFRRVRARVNAPLPAEDDTDELQHSLTRLLAHGTDAESLSKPGVWTLIDEHLGTERLQPLRPQHHGVRAVVERVVVENECAGAR
jgi:hypothetical protein